MGGKGKELLKEGKGKQSSKKTWKNAAKKKYYFN